jgi:hypothetical protein
MKLLNAAKNVPDPEVDGFCSSCGARPDLTRVERQGYVAYVLVHKDYCWYGELQNAIKLEERYGS